MVAKRPAYKGNPDLRQQKHVPAPSCEEIEKQLFSRLKPNHFKPLKLCEGKDKKKLRKRILTLPVMMLRCIKSGLPADSWSTRNSTSVIGIRVIMGRSN